MKNLLFFCLIFLAAYAGQAAGGRGRNRRQQSELIQREEIF